MNRKLGLLLVFFFAVAMVIIVPLIIGLFIGNEEVSNRPKQVRTEDKIPIVFWNLKDNEDAFRGPFQTFFSLNPQYKIEYLSFEDEENYNKVLEKALSEGWGPDIFTLKGRSFFANKDKVEPIPSGTYGFTLETFKQTFVPSAVNEVLLKKPEGEFIYGIPLFTDSLAIYYNKRNFQDFLPSEGRPSKFWNEIINQVKTLNKDDNSFERFLRTGIALGRSDNISMFDEILSLMFLQLGAPTYTPDMSNSIFSTFSAKSTDGTSFIPSERALEFFTSFARPSFEHYSWNDLITKRISPNDEIGAFARGKTSMILGTSQTYKEIINTITKLRGTSSSLIAEENIGISEIPQFSNEVRDALAIQYPLFVSKQSKNKDISFKLLSFLSETANIKYYLDATGKPPSRLDLINEYIQKEPVGIFALQSGFAKNYPIIDSQSFKESLEQAIDDLVNQYTDSKSAVRNINARLSCDLQIYKKNKDVLRVGCED